MGVSGERRCRACYGGFVLGFWVFVFRICLGFRIEDFEFPSLVVASATLRSGISQDRESRWELHQRSAFGYP